MRWLVRLARLQGIFYALTGAWALVHIESFMAVTGPKTDIWLVKTVGILVFVVGLVLLVAAARLRVTFEVALLAAGSALGLSAIDILYATTDVISNVYLLDAAAEVALAIAWAILFWRARNDPRVWGRSLGEPRPRDRRRGRVA